MRIDQRAQLVPVMLRRLVVELIGLAPDLIVANSTPALAALHAATTAIPVLFVLVVDPVGLGYIAGLSRPGGNITGFTYKEVSLIGKWLDLRARFAEERELRISLSALGIGKFVLDDLTEMVFPQHLHLGFDFRTAFADGRVREIISGPRCDVDYLRGELRRLGVGLVPGPP